MSVAPCPIFPEKPRRKPTKRTTRSKVSARNTRTDRNPKLSQSRRQTVEQLPKRSPKLPPQLQFMLRVQQGLSIITCSLILTTLGVYAWTVYVPKLWSKEYNKLETLQRHERHLTAANESLKNQLAQQAENPQTGLAAPKPDQSIFLPVTKEQPVTKVQKTVSSNRNSFLKNAPVSY